MKKAMLLCGMLLALTAVTANAQVGGGLNLRWQSCLGDGGAQNKTSACSNNLGSNLAVGSFQLASEIGRAHV